jgi:peptidoglycan/xylan/chitin deacetylase (PgdA/CDA1 family)
LKSALTFDDVNPFFLAHSDLKDLLGFLDKEKISATLFVIPEGLIAGPVDYVKLVQQAHDSGHEVALHGYGHTENEFGYIFPIPLPSYEKQKELLAKGKDELTRLLREEPLGFRAPDYRHSRITLRALRDLGFKYDSSKTAFKPTHGLRYRVKTRTPPKVMNLNGIVEIPVTADYTLSTATIGLDKRLQLAREDFNWVRRIGGTFVVNNHVDIAKGFVFEFLHSLINDIRDDTEFVRLKDLIL